MTRPEPTSTGSAAFLATMALHSSAHAAGLESSTTGALVGLAGGAGLLAAIVVILVLWRQSRARSREIFDICAMNEDLQRQKIELSDRLATASDRAAELETALKQHAGECGRFRELLDAAPVPIWSRDPNLNIVWTNRRYREATGGANPQPSEQDAEEIASSLDPDQPLRLAKKALTTGELHSEVRHFVINGDRRALEIVETPLAPGGALAGYAFDVTRLEDSQADLARHIEAHGEVLENIATAIAIYGPDKRLMFFNRAYSKLWRLDESLLNYAPHINEVIDAQRNARRLPEQADFKAYKEARLALFTNILEPKEELVQLPDETMLRTVVTPHPFGGLLFMFEDVTDNLVLERARNTLIAVYRATLDNLYEGIALFGLDGRLKLYNSGYARLWELDDEFLRGEPHINDIVDRTLSNFNYGPEIEEKRAEIVARTTSRSGASGEMKRPDGKVIIYGSVPLPDGQKLFTYYDVTDSRQIELALRERNDALLAADRLKSEFIANISYELRTPLNSIIGFAEILERKFFGDLNDRQTEYVDDILASSQQLLMLINSILDLASIEAGRMALDLGAVDVGELINSVYQITEGLAEKENLDLVVDYDPEVGFITADGRRLKQVVYNLVTNSLKFTQKGGKITIGAAREAGSVTFWVNDTGVGIPPDEQDVVFEKFRKATTDLPQHGAGLGLSLVRSFVELHGGTVELVSDPGIGTEVRCRLPDRSGEMAEPPSRQALSM